MKDGATTIFAWAPRETRGFWDYVSCAPRIQGVDEAPSIIGLTPPSLKLADQLSATPLFSVWVGPPYNAFHFLGVEKVAKTWQKPCWIIGPKKMQDCLVSYRGRAAVLIITSTFPHPRTSAPVDHLCRQALPDSPAQWGANWR